MKRTGLITTGKRIIVSALICSMSVSMLSGCASGGLSETEMTAKDNELTQTARNMDQDRLYSQIPYREPMEILMSDETRETENVKEEASVKDTAAGAAASGVVVRPGSNDFDWAWNVEDIFDVPKGASALTASDQITGSWNVLLVGDDSEYYHFFSMLNATITEKKSNITMTADWYRSALVNKNTGEYSTLDGTLDKDTVYSGSFNNGHMYVYDPNPDTVMQYMFVNGKKIYDFLIVNWYEQGSRQYGMGIFSTKDGEPIGRVYMVRNASKYAGKLKTPASTPEWEWYAGYWTWEYEDPVNWLNDERLYLWIIPRTADSIYIYQEQEWESGGEICGVKYDKLNDALAIYDPQGEYLGELRATSYDGQDAVFLTGFDAEMLMRTDESTETQDHWDYIVERHVEYEQNVYDGIW